MFYLWSKVLDLAFSPVCHALALGAGSVVALRLGRPRLGRTLAALAWLVIYAFATGGLAWALMRYVEQFEGARAKAAGRYDAVILLGGFASRGPGGQIELSDGADRLLSAFQLLKGGRAAQVVIAGGNGRGGEPEADVAASLLIEAGIDDARILRDRKSRNTRENALEVRALVQRHRLRRLVLVTSAFHMQRALECMRAVGLTPDALATDHLAQRPRSWFDLVAPRADNLRSSELALRELAGRWVYRARGYAVRP